MAATSAADADTKSVSVLSAREWAELTRPAVAAAASSVKEDGDVQQQQKKGKAVKHVPIVGGMEFRRCEPLLESTSDAAFYSGTNAHPVTVAIALHAMAKRIYDGAYDDVQPINERQKQWLDYMTAVKPTDVNTSDMVTISGLEACKDTARSNTSRVSAAAKVVGATLHELATIQLLDLSSVEEAVYLIPSLKRFDSPPSARDALQTLLDAMRNSNTATQAAAAPHTVAAS